MCHIKLLPVLRTYFSTTPVTEHHQGEYFVLVETLYQYVGRDNTNSGYVVFNISDVGPFNDHQLIIWLPCNMDPCSVWNAPCRDWY